ncbi:hypothetical protein CEUSTIGMA_g5250.t1 [Chlamydomonas eustigma]|uniref:Glycosyltransferase 2-like domain-containing protein n=1 Tax=Chlamydomonas eustigma TaxID=1157962 RepID=A0A250X403_9CHLO|nr:hypothetical protein CEUSTIGMA_g5250.t1 [Chlamydomonas eustigma]|eukprot:GAX77807.1 hypothetical protein CEUSTIGMA_g5250.t1 [Chlamydomonas eustigma]
MQWTCRRLSKCYISLLISVPFLTWVTLRHYTLINLIGRGIGDRDLSGKFAKSSQAPIISWYLGPPVRSQLHKYVPESIDQWPDMESSDSCLSNISTWLRSEQYIGWCNTPLSGFTSCAHGSCMHSFLTGDPIDLDKKPFTKVPKSDTRACMGPVGGQQPFHMTVSTTHTISFILTTRNNDAKVYKTMLELFRTAKEAPSIQFVVYDDASDHVPSRVVVALHTMREQFGTNVLFIRGNTTLGASGAIHAAIQASSGEFFVLVSAGTYVTPGWLSALLFTLLHMPLAGMAGPLYVSDSNMITNAGGILYDDARPAIFGQMVRPSHEFLFSRRVDFVSPDCFMMRRQTYHEVGTLDQGYDKGSMGWGVDLALAVRKAGKYIYMQPGSVVYHQDGSLPLRTGDIGDQDQVKLQEKWRDLLSVHEDYFPHTWPLQECALQRYPRRVLWITFELPEDIEASARKQEARHGFGGSRAITIIHGLISAGYLVRVQPLVDNEPNGSVWSANSLMAQLHGAEVLKSKLQLKKEDFLMSAPIGGRSVCAYELFLVTGSSLLTFLTSILREACPDVPFILDLPASNQVRSALLTELGEKLLNRGHSPSLLSTLYNFVFLRDKSKEKAPLQDLSERTWARLQSQTWYAELERDMKAMRTAAVTLTSTKLEELVLQRLLISTLQTSGSANHTLPQRASPLPSNPKHLDPCLISRGSTGSKVESFPSVLAIPVPALTVDDDFHLGVSIRLPCLLRTAGIMVLSPGGEAGDLAADDLITELLQALVGLPISLQRSITIHVRLWSHLSNVRNVLDAISKELRGAWPGGLIYHSSHSSSRMAQKVDLLGDWDEIRVMMVPPAAHLGGGGLGFTWPMEMIMNGLDSGAVLVTSAVGAALLGVPGGLEGRVVAMDDGTPLNEWAAVAAASLRCEAVAPGLIPESSMSSRGRSLRLLSSAWHATGRHGLEGKDEINAFVEEGTGGMLVKEHSGHDVTFHNREDLHPSAP